MSRPHGNQASSANWIQLALCQYPWAMTWSQVRPTCVHYLLTGSEVHLRATPCGPVSTSCQTACFTAGFKALSTRPVVFPGLLSWWTAFACCHTRSFWHRSLKRFLIA